MSSDTTFLCCTMSYAIQVMSYAILDSCTSLHTLYTLVGHVHLTDFNVACYKEQSPVTACTGTRPYMGEKTNCMHIYTIKKYT